ncbi:RidA family protein [Streptantibioticus rubrisoli]|uniref:RidA family protein n=1 Tax=Streptantibioticus rubrisoli TaxID=1387313 RepID=A0ABT1PMI0_9ACTN|nr:RidA family protein [Streptantibioticus rubrisoli]MCQ4046557.1 RidA family protein [Streptantibioticus rubrisoli]
MGRELITRGKLPGYRYSPGVLVGNTAYLAGHFGVDSGGRLVAADVAAQGRQALTNLGSTLEAAGMTLADVVSMRVWLTTYDNMPAFDEAYGEFFPADPPARTAFMVERLPLGAAVELDAIAVRESAEVKARLA